VPQDSPLPLPDNVAQLAQSARLGAFQRVYLPKRRSWALIIANLIIALLTLFVLVGFWLLWVIFRMPNLSRSQAARRLYLYEQGFIVANRPDDPQVYRWDEINAVFQKIVSTRTYGIETARQYQYTITRRDGRTEKLTQFWDGIADLGPHINQCVSTALLPGTLAAIDHGQAVRFGDMTLSAGGIAGRRKSVSWAEVSQVQIYNGYVRIGVAGKFFSLSTTAAADIPNLPLFLGLTERMRKTAAR
jgi:Family of unknown function (DUF6585)